MQAQVEFPDTAAAVRLSLAEQYPLAPTPVQPTLNPHVQYPAERVVEFLSSREGFKAIATPIVQIGLIYFTPGLGARAFGSLTSAPGIINNLRTIASYSTQSWLSFFTPEMSLFGITLWGVKTYASAKLLNALCQGPFIDNYAAWRIARMQAFYDNLMVPEKFHDDPFLKANICGITHSPIRYPVRDKYGRYWEHGAISAWLCNSKTCPLTRQRLTESDLTFDEKLFQEISKRIELLMSNSETQNI